MCKSESPHIATPEEWRHRRSKLNHDWLKNCYIRSIDAFLSRCEHEVADEERIVRFLNYILPEWEDKRQEFRYIIESCEVVMSPARLLGRSSDISSFCEPDSWAGMLVDQLWRSRHPIDEWLNEARLAFEKTDSSYDTLACAIRDVRSRPNELRGVGSLLPQFREFRCASIQLSRALSQLPSEILVA